MNTAEDIIISKRFFELTPAERETVKELATNEEDYEAMRWFLMSTGTAFAQDKIEPSANLKRGVMAHLQQKQTATKTIWLNGVGAFLFPSDKKFYQYPALQIAAVAALIVSAVLVYESSNPIQQELAINDQVETTISPETPVAANDLKQDIGSPAESSQVAVTEKSEDMNNVSGPVTYDEVRPAQNEYYREMSVAEEVKVVQDMDMLEEESSFEQTNDITTVTTNSGSTVVLDNKQSSQTEYKFELAKKESDASKQTGKDKNAKLEDLRSDDEDKTVALGSEANAPAGTGYATGTTVSGEAERDGEKYRTATAGGVFGDTALDSTGTVKPDTREESQTKFSVTDSKILKKLFFVVK